MQLIMVIKRPLTLIKLLNALLSISYYYTSYCYISTKCFYSTYLKGFYLYCSFILNGF
jgi:hypothetical protein